MSNSWFPNQGPQQWNTPTGFNPQQQQQQGWVTGGGGGEQWQPMQQAGQPGGFVYQPAQQFTSQAQQFPGPGQQYHPGHVQQFQTRPGYGGNVPSSNTGQGFPQQQIPPPQQQFQQQQFQQQQQMAYIQEQQKRLKEEERKREMEKQQHKLRNMDVTKPTGGSLSFDNLVGLTPSQEKARDSPSLKRGKTTQTIPSETSSAPPGQSQAPTVSASSGQGSSEVKKEPSVAPSLPPMASSAAPEKKQEKPTQGTHVQQPEISLEKLMESTLSNLNEPSPSTKKRIVFKTTHTNRPLPANSSPKTFAQSRKARAWTAGETDFSGVFSLHQDTQPEQDDSFGEFQSVGGGGPPASVIPEQQAGFQGSSFPQQNAPGPGMMMTQNVPGQPLGQAVPLPGQAIQIPGQAVQFPGQPLSGREQAQPQYFANSSVTFTSTHLHPLPSTSISGTTTLTTSNSSMDRTGGPAKGQFANLEASKFPRLYLEVFRQSVKSGEAHVSTELLFPILLSSQLPKNVLRDLWSVANRKIPGKLDQTELFVLLGLIGLAQSGVASPTPEDLKRAPAPPIPKLSAIKEFSPHSQNAAHPILPQPASVQQPPTSPPVDDFGDFSQYQAPVKQQQPVAVSSSAPVISNQPAMPLQLTTVPASSTSSQLLEQLSSTSEYKPPPGDKYSVFNEFQAVSQPKQIMQVSHSPVLVPKTGTIQSTSSTGDMKQLTKNEGLSTLNSAHSFSSGALASTDTFGAFAQAPSMTKNTGSGLDLVGATAVTTPSISGPSNNDQGWADFASFSAPPQPPLTAATSLAPMTTTNSNLISTTTRTTSSFAAFDSITIPELSAKQPSPVTSSEEIATVGSGTMSTVVGPSLFEVKPAPENTPSLKKHLTGLEILEEEFSARVAQSHAEKEAIGSSILHPLVPESAPLDEFGEFETYSSPGHEKKKETHSLLVKESPPSVRTQSKTIDPCTVWHSCLKKCAEVLVSCADMFSDVEEPNVLKEIANSEEGRNKLRGIVEVYRLAKRIHYSLKDKDKGVDNEDSVKTIQKQWKKLDDIFPDDVMQNLYSEKVKVEPEEEVDVLSGTISTCCLCLLNKTVSISSLLALDGKKEEYSVPMLFHQGQCYHVTCANFWINVVQEELPVLA